MANADVSASPIATKRERLLGPDILRILSMCGVLAIHTSGHIVAGADRQSVDWWAALFFNVGFIWAVPVFVMLSGIFSLDKRAFRDGIGAYYTRRARKLVPAFVFWTLAYFSIRVLVLDQSFSKVDILRLLFDAQVYPQLYFLPLMMGLVAVAPVLATFLHEGGRSRALITAAVALAFALGVVAVSAFITVLGIPRAIALNTFTMWIPYVGYFVAGYALYGLKLRKRTLILLSTGGLLALALTIAQASHRGSYPLLQALVSPGYLGLGVCMLSVAVFTVGITVFDRVKVGVRAQRFIERLANASYGVFLVHMVVLLVLNRTVGAYREEFSALAGAGVYLIVLVTSYAIALFAQRIPYIREVF